MGTGFHGKAMVRMAPDDPRLPEVDENSPTRPTWSDFMKKAEGDLENQGQETGEKDPEPSHTSVAKRVGPRNRRRRR